MSANLSVKIESCFARVAPEIAAAWHRNNPGDNLGQVNDYLRLELGLMSATTIEARECLVDNIAEKDWLRHFRKYVVPLVVQNGGLPSWK